MAVSKRYKVKQSEGGPNAEAFVRLIDEGLAEPRDVVSAYFATLTKQDAEKAYPEVLCGSKVVSERPKIDPDSPPSPGDRLVRLYRELVVFDGDAR